MPVFIKHLFCLWIFCNTTPVPKPFPTESVVFTSTCTWTINSNHDVVLGPNCTADDIFVDAANGDFHLKFNSPAIGNALCDSSIPKTDFDGNPRPTSSNNSCDIGAFQYIGAINSTLDITYLGITGEDLVGDTCNLGPNGVKDLHIALKGLRNSPTKVIVSSTDGGKGGGYWEFPCNQAMNWTVAGIYSPPTGNLFIEPWPLGNSLTVNVFYNNGTSDTKTIPLNPIPPLAPTNLRRVP